MTKIAVVQTNPVLGRRQENLAKSLALMETKQADLYVLPELAMEGYHFSTQAQAASLAGPAGQGPVFEAIRNFAKSRQAYVCYGFAEKTQEGLYNSANLVGPDKLVSTYRKTHLFAREKLFFKPGNTGFQVFDLPFGKVGMMICFDWIFPEAMRSLALKGAQLILHPANLVLPYCPEAMKTRCLENRVFSATANRIGQEKGPEKDLTFIGMSEIVAPDGDIKIRLGNDTEGIGMLECDLKEALDKTVTPYNDLFKDRQSSFYIL